MQTLEKLCSKYTKEQLDLKDNLFKQYIEQFKQPFDQNYTVVELDENMVYIKYPNFDADVCVDVFDDDGSMAMERYNRLFKEEQVSSLLAFDYVKGLHPASEYGAWLNSLDTICFHDVTEADVYKRVRRGSFMNINDDGYINSEYKGSIIFDKMDKGTNVDLIYYTGMLKRNGKYTLYYKGQPQNKGKYLKEIFYVTKFNIENNFNEFINIVESFPIKDKTILQSRRMIVYDLNKHCFKHFAFADYYDDYPFDANEKYTILPVETRKDYQYYKVGDIISMDDLLLVYYE